MCLWRPTRIPLTLSSKRFVVLLFAHWNIFSKLEQMNFLINQGVNWENCSSSQQPNIKMKLMKFGSGTLDQLTNILKAPRHTQIILCPLIQHTTASFRTLLDEHKFVDQLSVPTTRRHLRPVTAVLPDLPWVREAPATLLAGVELLASVDLHVGLQLIWLVELPVTVQTFKWFLTRVDPQVSVEVSVGPEGLAALVAFVWFFTSVYSLMLLQTTGMEKSLPAHITNKGLLSWVASLMITERVFVMERLPTYAAVKLLVLTVTFFVEFEGTCGAETSQTYFATVRFNQRLVSLSGLEKS